jgi:hypothetical protein
MATDHRDEIAASAAALQDLGPGYDQALAEGLVDRIGAEIDQRIAAEIENRVTAEVDSRILTQLDRYAGCRHQRRRAKRMVRAEQRALRAERADRSGRSAIMLALGSMLITLPVTAIVLKGSPGLASIMLMAMIWVIVAIINVAYAISLRTSKGAALLSQAMPPGSVTSRFSQAALRPLVRASGRATDSQARIEGA